MSTQGFRNLPEEPAATRYAGARNRLPGTIMAVKKDGLVAQVEMACGPYRIVSLMSRESADELDLKPGDPATAIVKSAAVFVEPTDRSPLAGVR
ncbi:MAG TPA: TOBE domain-containing protein [Solirubrobacteraceae bacterium]